jgi:hypothetical protein
MGRSVSSGGLSPADLLLHYRQVLRIQVEWCGWRDVQPDANEGRIIGRYSRNKSFCDRFLKSCTQFTGKPSAGVLPPVARAAYSALAYCRNTIHEQFCREPCLNSSGLYSPLPRRKAFQHWNGSGKEISISTEHIATHITTGQISVSPRKRINVCVVNVAVFTRENVFSPPCVVSIDLRESYRNPPAFPEVLSDRY